jgi:hypothetical protein
VDPYRFWLASFHHILNRRYRYHPKVRVKGHKLMITAHNLPDTLRAGLTEAEKQILEMGKDQTSISFWPSPAAYAHLVLEKHAELLEHLEFLWRARFSTKSLRSYAAPEKLELTQKSEGLALVGETTADEAEGSTVGGELAGATGKAGDWMEVIKEGGSWGSARTIRAAFLGYLLGEGFFPKGLILVGARLVGPWQWKGAFPAHGLALIGCYIEGPIQLTEVEAPAFSLFLGSCYIANPEEDNEKTNSPLLLLQQTQLHRLYFEDCRIGGPIHLKGFRTVQGNLCLVKTLIPSSEVALRIENTVFERDLWLSEAHFGGAVHLEYVKVEGEISIKSSRIESSSDVALRIEDMEGGADLSLQESHLKGRVVLELAEVGNIHIKGSVIATPGPLAVHLSGVRARGLSMEEALFRWIAGGSEAESPALSDGDSLILVSIGGSHIVEGNISVKNIQRAPVEVVLGEGATEGSSNGGGAERGAVRATFQVMWTKLRPWPAVNPLIVVAVVGAWDVKMAHTEVLGDLQIAVGSAESVIMMRDVRVQRDMLLAEAEKGSSSVGRVELEDVEVGGRLQMRGLRVEKELSLKKGWVGGGVYLEEVEVGRVEAPGRLHLEGLRAVELDLSGAEVRGALSLLDVYVHTYSDRPWAGLKAIEVKDFSWVVMPLEREAGSLRWRLSWWWKMPLERRVIYMSRLYQSYRVRYYQPPLRIDSEKRYSFLFLLLRRALQDSLPPNYLWLFLRSSHFVGYTAAERRRLRWRMRFMRGIEFALTLLSLILLPLLYLFYLLLLGMAAIVRFFQRFRRGHEPRSGSGHEKKEE